jgi:hypothetical protein
MMQPFSRGYTAATSPFTPMAVTLLTNLLRAGAVLLALAAVAVLLPASTMAAINAWLGLAPLPDSPITYYLARSTSAHYALRGAIVWLASTDPIRYRALVVLLGVSNLVFGIALLGIGVTAGMPAWWTAIEGPGVVAIGIVLLLLVRHVPREARAVTA